MFLFLGKVSRRLAGGGNFMENILKLLCNAEMKGLQWLYETGYAYQKTDMVYGSGLVLLVLSVILTFEEDTCILYP